MTNTSIRLLVISWAKRSVKKPFETHDHKDVSFMEYFIYFFIVTFIFCHFLNKNFQKDGWKGELNRAYGLAVSDRLCAGGSYHEDQK